MEVLRMVLGDDSLETMKTVLEQNSFSNYFSSMAVTSSSLHLHIHFGDFSVNPLLSFIVISLLSFVHLSVKSIR